MSPTGTTNFPTLPASLPAAARQRTASQRAKKRGAEQRAERIVWFFRRGHVVPNMSKHDIELCQSVENRMHVGMASERQS